MTPASWFPLRQELLLLRCTLATEGLPAGGPGRLSVLLLGACRGQHSLRFTVSSVSTQGRHLLQASVSGTAGLF